MRKRLLPLLACTFLFAVACNDTETTDSKEVAEEKNEAAAENSDGALKEDDTDFVVETASSGLMEVQLGEMAAKSATAANVKEFAQMMVTDHSKANEELKALAGQKGIAIPSTPGEKHMGHINSMQEKKGADFDRDYMKMMVEHHEEDVSEFEEASQSAKDPDIKAFAAKTLPVLRQHLEKARSIRDAQK